MNAGVRIGSMIADYPFEPAKIYPVQYDIQVIATNCVYLWEHPHKGPTALSNLRYVGMLMCLSEDSAWWLRTTTDLIPHARDLKVVVQCLGDVIQAAAWAQVVTPHPSLEEGEVGDYVRLSVPLQVPVILTNSDDPDVVL